MLRLTPVRTLLAGAPLRAYSAAPAAGHGAQAHSGGENNFRQFSGYPSLYAPMEIRVKVKKP